jgi:hypothetical protein
LVLPLSDAGEPPYKVKCQLTNRKDGSCIVCEYRYIDTKSTLRMFLKYSIDKEYNITTAFVVPNEEVWNTFYTKDSHGENSGKIVYTKKLADSLYITVAEKEEIENRIQKYIEENNISFIEGACFEDMKQEKSDYIFNNNFTYCDHTVTFRVNDSTYGLINRYHIGRLANQAITKNHILKYFPDGKALNVRGRRIDQISLNQFNNIVNNFKQKKPDLQIPFIQFAQAADGYASCMELIDLSGYMQ